ncbi:MAG: 1-acyl-sn-glycerol-3-phosphate acyltransferase [Lachnoclostridium sp.]|nr:1-acyl-sn-glycerol-3-phosphate acyltransferase [Lachnoclostridium sp.]
MIRFIILCMILAGFLIFGYPLLIMQNSLGKKDPTARGHESTGIVRFMFGLFLKVAGVKVTVKGAENIPTDRAVLYVGNHRSYFDILVGYTTTPGLVGFVAKKEMRKFPILNRWMDNVNCLFLDRQDIKAGLKTILEGIEYVKNGISMWIFPEGTRARGKDELDMLPFKEGSLKIAEKSGCPVIPVAMVRTADIFEKHTPRVVPTEVTVYYGKPIYLKELEPEQRKRAGAYTKEVIADMIREIM